MSADPGLVPDEDHSTGTAWRTPEAATLPVLPEHMTPCTLDEQAEHRAALIEGIAGFMVGRRSPTGDLV